MGHLAVVFLLLLSISWATCNEMQEGFLECMSSILTTGFNKTSTHIYFNDSPLYTSLLQSSQQNPRFLSSTTPKPLLIITPDSDPEIQATVHCSRKQGLQIRARSGGHDYEGLSYLCKTPFIIVDLINLRSININMEDETAWVQTGASIGEVYNSIAQKSRVHGFPGGLCPGVGFGGLISGGGFGTLLRKYGLGADNIVDAYLIDVYGRFLDRETMGEDLFWAIRGGGGASFGIIVSWKIKLVRVPPTVTVFAVDKKLEEGATRLIHRWQYIADKLPEDLFIRIIIQNIDGRSQGKNKTVQATFQSLFLGRVNELMPLMGKSFPELGLREEEPIEMTWIESALYFAGYPRGASMDNLLNRTDLFKSIFKAKSDFVKAPIPESGLEGIWERFLKEEQVFMILDPFGGKMNEISENALPFPHRKGNLYNIQYIVKWGENGVMASYKHVQWIRKLYRYMKAYVSKSPRAAYLNYRDLDLGINREGNTSYAQAAVWGRKYFKGNFEKLVQVKRKIDPSNYFRNEQSIPLLPKSRKRQFN